MLHVKLLLHEFYRKGRGWDGDTPSTYLSRWCARVNWFPKLSEFSVDRCVQCPDFRRTVPVRFTTCATFFPSLYREQGAIFAWSTQMAIFIALLWSGSLVSPQIIPRPEFSNSHIVYSLERNADTTTFWMDSMTVIRYSTRMNPSVFILTLPKVLLWLETIPVLHNPANDDASRGAIAESELMICPRSAAGLADDL